MSRILFANTNFENELSSLDYCSILEGVEKNPLFMQLQFLPFLYADPKDTVLLTNLPKDSYLEMLSQAIPCDSPRLLCLNDDHQRDFSCHKLYSWGYSKQLSKWAKKHGISYDTPPWGAITSVNRKDFAFIHSSQLPGAALLFCQKEVDQWLKKPFSKKVFKSCFGVAAKGNLIVDTRQPRSLSRLFPFLQQQWKRDLPVIAEPWVERFLDFSTHWYINPKKQFNYLGAAVMKNDSKGMYVQSIVANEEKLFSRYLWALEEHFDEAKKLLKKIASQGYFGHVGIDAMLYRWPGEEGKLFLQAIVEVNARQTMSFIAILHQRLYYSDKCLYLSYSRVKKKGKELLPKKLQRSNGSVVTFSRQLYSRVEEV